MKLVFIGAGGFALELEQCLLDCRAAGKGVFDEQGFAIGDDAAELSGVCFVDHGRLFDFQTRNLSRHEINRGDVRLFRYVIAIGDPIVRHRLWIELRAIGARFATIVHPSCTISATATLGAGSILCAHTFVGAKSQIGQNCLLNPFASVHHDACLGDHGVLSPYACLNGASVLGLCGFMGTGALLAPKTRVGEFGEVGAGAVVLADWGDHCLLVGTPAARKEKSCRNARISGECKSVAK